MKTAFILLFFVSAASAITWLHSGNTTWAALMAFNAAFDLAMYLDES